MPAAKMVADSTQSDAALERKKRRRDEKDHHRNNVRGGSRSRSSQANQRNSSNSSRRSAWSHSEKSSQKEEDSDNSDMDLRKPLKPINSYIKNRSEMLDQMFHCIKGNTLKRAIPDGLQGMNPQELKQRCLAQLEVMSKKRILRILSGDDPANISSSGTEESGDDIENNERKITMDLRETSHSCSIAESHPADSTSSSSTSSTSHRKKSTINKDSDLSVVSPSNDGQSLPPQPMANQSLNVQVAGYSHQTIGTGVSTSYPGNHVAGSNWLQPSDQPPVISLQAEAGHLQSRPHIPTKFLPPYRQTLEVDCSDVPINIAPPKTRKVKNVSILPHSQAHQHHLQQKTQQWNAASGVRPFACSGSDYCICGRCSASSLLSQASATTSSGVAGTDLIGVCPNSNTQVIPGSTPGGAFTTEQQAVPARVLARTQMEILELEMRARAIKAMLQAASQCPPLHQQQQHQPPPSS